MAQAFKLGDKAGLFRRQDAGPVAAASGIGCGTLILVLFILFVLLVLMSNCSGSLAGRAQLGRLVRWLAVAAVTNESFFHPTLQGANAMMGIEWLRPAAFLGPSSTR